MPRTARASFTATSSPPTFSSARAATPRSSTSGWRKWERRSAHEADVTDDGRHAAGASWSGNRRLYGAGAGARRGGRSPRRHLELRPGALRNGQGDAARAAAVRLRVEASPELERIVSKCLETDRELRYQHAADLRTDLERLRRGQGANGGAARGARASPRAVVRDRRGRRRRHRRCRGRDL